MRIFKYTGSLLLILLFFTACENEKEEEIVETISKFDQLVSEGEISGSLSPFPLIHISAYKSLEEFTELRDHDLVLLTSSGDQVYVYPHREMYVEVVNEDFGDGPVAITFCPITKSGMGWDRIIGQDTMVLTASGYLLMDNLMPLDTVTASIFSQMHSRGYKGVYDKRKVSTFSLIETTWETVKIHFHDALVFDGAESLRLCGEPGSESRKGRSIQFSESQFTETEKYFGVIETTGVSLLSYSDFPGRSEEHTSELQSR